MKNIQLFVCNLQENATGRMLWFDPTDLMHYPAIFDKTIFNLKQVAYEVETSVMSKVSCTACKAGKRMKSIKNTISSIKLMI